jgi:branched-chain amino acid transport system ATP-binding protein
MRNQKGNTEKDPPLLKINALSKAFGGVKAIQQVTFGVEPMTVQGLIGPNGAGKTTLFNLITGVYKPDSGEILFCRQTIEGRETHELVALGIARTFQNVELFESMTVLENVMVGQYVQTRSGFWSAIARTPFLRREERKSRKEALELLDFVGLADQAQGRSGDLPFGWQRLLEIARALASKPKMLLLDEPAAGLNAVETKRLGDLLLQIRERGISLLLVEHDMSLTMEISDRIAVLDQGKLIAEGKPRDIQSNETVMTAYLGKRTT